MRPLERSEREEADGHIEFLIKKPIHAQLESQGSTFYNDLRATQANSSKTAPTLFMNTSSTSSQPPRKKIYNSQPRANSSESRYISYGH
uniref:Uncharacterized protein n=1 Tax=Lactuca sativa TaxID=4236 RepID=A0A9R1XPI0_LACSA|nr:hypothetical protein LSAT_V11C200070780 [Lactuca sativa]